MKTKAQRLVASYEKWLDSLLQRHRDEPSPAIDGMIIVLTCVIIDIKEDFKDEFISD